MTDRLFRSGRPQDEPTLYTWLFLALAVAIGAVLRFWGLGNIGLHGDEEVMSLSARSILENGSPILPSGMYYLRALPQLYMMAGSIHLFGETEWALRLPSALAGTLGVLAAYLMARRFLTAQWATLFALAIAVLPSLIALSQTARMYVFFVTLVMFFAAAVFRWERTESTGPYLLAIVICMVSITFHSLTVFATLLYFYPGIAKASVRLFAYGGVAFAASLGWFRAYSAWTSSQYFELVNVAPDDDGGLSSAALGEPGMLAILLASLAAASIAGVAFAVVRRKDASFDRAAWLGLSSGCLAGAVLFTLIVQYHLAGLALVLGALIGFRAKLSWRIIGAAGALVVALMAIRFVLLWQANAPDDFNHFIVTTLGKPSPWPYLIFAGMAPLAVGVYGIAALYFVIRFARGEGIPDHFLFMLMSVFIPLFLIGFFAEHLPERYVVGLLPFFLLAFFAGVLELLSRSSATFGTKPVAQAACAVLLVALVVNPVELKHNVNPHYADFRHLTVSRGADHKGAAEFVLSRELDADDVLIAMDAQQQRYYLGEALDYYLRALNEDRNSSFMHDGQMLNLYTGTPQIATGEELKSVLDGNGADDIFILGSGELMSNLPRYMGDGIWETMGEYDLEVVYEGRDGATKVWHYRSGSTGTR
jgi:hypothetical protein